MATRSDILAMRVSSKERELIEQYAKCEERSISDTMRRIILKAVEKGEPQSLSASQGKRTKARV